MTTPTITHEQQRDAIARLTALFGERAQAEADIRRRQAERSAITRHEHDRDERQAQEQFAAEHAQLAGAYKEAREAVFRQYETAGFKLAQEEERFVAQAEQEHAEQREAGKALCQHQSQKIQSAYKADSRRPRSEFAQFKQQCEARLGEIQSLIGQAQKIVRRRCEWPAEPPPPMPPLPALSSLKYVERFTAAMQRAYQQVYALQHLRAARFLEDGWPVLIFMLAASAAGLSGWLLLHALGWGWVVAAALAGPRCSCAWPGGKSPGRSRGGKRCSSCRSFRPRWLRPAASWPRRWPRP